MRGRKRERKERGERVVIEGKADDIGERRARERGKKGKIAGNIRERSVE